MTEPLEMAPDFTLPVSGPVTGPASGPVTGPGTGGTDVTLSALRPAPVVLFFYPRDDTSGCTRENEAFTALLPDFTALGVKVFGLSKDSIASHDKFMAKKALTVPLLSDEHGTVCEDYGIWTEKSMYGKKFMGIERSTFLIDGSGRIAKRWSKVKVPGHAEDVLNAVKDL